MPDSAIVLTAAPDFSGLKLTRNANGYVHSPWFTFDWKRGQPGEQPYDMGGKYHAIQYEAKRAFAAVLGLGSGSESVIVTESKDICPGEIWWRLGTATPVEWPKPPRLFKPRGSDYPCSDCDWSFTCYGDPSEPCRKQPPLPALDA